jgi:hypothetical protein
MVSGFRQGQPNTTLSVDGDAIRKIRKIAVKRDTTLTAMVREFLMSVAEGEGHHRAQRVCDLERSFAVLSRSMGRRSWTRDDLHVR